MPMGIGKLAVRKREGAPVELVLPNGVVVPAKPEITASMGDYEDGCIVEAECLLQNDTALVVKILGVVAAAGAEQRKAAILAEARAVTRRQEAVRERIPLEDVIRAFGIVVPRGIAAAWEPALEGNANPLGLIVVGRSTLPAFLQLAAAVTRKHFSGDGDPKTTKERPHLFLPLVTEKGGTHVGLYLEARLDGDFPVVRVGTTVELVAVSSAEWLRESSRP